jgi:cysteine-rich repeat protein
MKKRMHMIPVLLLACLMGASCGPAGGDEDAEDEGRDLADEDGSQDDPVLPDGAETADPLPDDAAADDAPVEDLTLDDVSVDEAPADMPVDPDAEPPVTCGDGEVNHPDEECDDGNLDNSDDCTTFCLDARCGDGFARAGHEECDDGNAVPDDGCDPDCTFSCEHTDTTTPYNDPDCDDGDECTVEEICDPYVYTCSYVNAADGVICGGGGDLCTGVLQCQSGVCTAMSPMDCSDDNPCTSDGCDPSEGCVNEPLPDGSECDDGLFCWTGDQCRGGTCSGSSTPSVCDDSNPCTVDVCNEASDSCSYETPTYRAVSCGGTSRGSTLYGASNYSGVTCSGTYHAAPGPDDVLMVEVSAAGTLTVNLGNDSISGAAIFVLTDPCSPSSCLDRGSTGDPVSLSVSAGTYYVLVETPAGGGAWRVTTSCP